MNRPRVLLASVCCALVVSTIALAAPTTQPTRLAQMETIVGRFETHDREGQTPAVGQIEFYGSSTIAMWDVNKWFDGLPVFNRGFGGSQMADAAHFAKRIVTPYKPKLVVLYEGDNDVADGVSGKLIVEALERFDADVHRELPDTRILVLAIKPSVLRWKLSDKMRDANRLIEQFVQQHADHMSYVDLGPLLLDEKGEPRPELYKADGLHMNEDGYKLWSEKLRPILMDAAQQQQH